MKRPGYRHLIAGILALYLLIIIGPFEDLGAPLRVAVSGVLLVMAVRTRRRAGVWEWRAVALAAALVVATVIAIVVGSATALTCVAQASTATLVIATMVILAQALLASGVVNASAVRGVLCIYLLMGLFFSTLNDFSAALIPHYLDGAGTHPSESDTLYFSLITLTTVGYGDIVPVSNVARAISSIEALVGQLYLVSIVAAVIARYEPQPRAAAAETDVRHPQVDGDGKPPDSTAPPSDRA